MTDKTVSEEARALVRDLWGAPTGTWKEYAAERIEDLRREARDAALEEAAAKFEQRAREYALCATFAKDISERQNFKNAQATNQDVADEIRALKSPAQEKK